MKPLHSWFARQSLTVKLLVTVPFLAAAVFWSAVPDTSAPAAPANAPTSRPVLSADRPNTPDAQPTLTPHQEPLPAETGLTWISALRTIVSVAVVLGLIVVSAKGLKHVMANAGQLPGTGAALKVLETSYLPSPNGKGRSAIHLVETSDGRQLLIGATDTTLSLLAEYDDTSRPKLVDPTPTPAASFTDLLAAASEKTPSSDELAERLRRLRQSKLRLEAAV